MSTTFLALAEGGAVMLIAAITILIAMVYGLFSRTGSAITEPPYGLRLMTRGTR